MTQLSDDILVALGPFGLRRQDHRDWEFLYEIDSHPALRQYVGGVTQDSRASWMEKRAKCGDGNCDFTLVERGSNADRYAGSITLDPTASDRREVFIFLHASFLRRGIGKYACRLACAYAFGRLGVSRIEAAAHPDHIASRRLVEEMGFKPTGYEARNYGTGKNLVECPVYALLKSDYRPGLEYFPR